MDRLKFILFLKRIFYKDEIQINSKIYTNINLLGFNFKIRNKARELDFLNQQIINLNSEISNLSRQVALDRVLLERSVDVKNLPPAKGNLRTVQLIKTKLLELVSVILEENNIMYWLDYGTLIGAIRHNGFIPWDDDVDVSLLKDDYLKLPQIFEKLCVSNPDFSFTFNWDINVIQRFFYKDFCVDFFPFEYVKYNCRSKSDKINYEKNWYKIHNEFFKKYPEQDIKNKTIDFNEVKYDIENIKRDNFNNTDCETLSNEQIIFSPEYTFVMNKCAVLDIDNILPLSSHKFENLVLPVPNNPIEHLFAHNIYGAKGAVMDLPKITDSGFHHTQESYANSNINFDIIYQELCDLVEYYKVKV